MLPQIINRIKANKEFKDTIYLYILQIVDKITPLAIVPYLMFILGAENMGILDLLQLLFNMYYCSLSLAFI